MEAEGRTLIGSWREDLEVDRFTKREKARSELRRRGAEEAKWEDLKRHHWQTKIMRPPPMISAGEISPLVAASKALMWAV